MIEFHIPELLSSSLSKSICNLSGFFDTFNLTMCDLNELISTLISEEFSGVSVPSCLQIVFVSDYVNVMLLQKRTQQYRKCRHFFLDAIVITMHQD